MTDETTPGSDPDSLPDGSQTDTTPPKPGGDTTSGGAPEPPEK